MENFSSKLAKFIAIVMLPVRFDVIASQQQKWCTHNIINLLFGMAKNATSATPFRCARRTLLCISPFDIYNG